MEITKRSEVYADFQNADAQGRVRLNCVGTINDLSLQQVQLRAGLGLFLYSDDADADGRATRLVSEGTVSYSQDEQCWVASIDWQKIRHEAISSLSEPNVETRGTVLTATNVSGSQPPRPAGR